LKGSETGKLFLECAEKPMAAITGKLISDLQPNGIVRMVFSVGGGSGTEPALTVKNLDTTELEFVRTLGLTPERVGRMHAQLERNRIFCAEVSLEDEVAAMFRVPYLCEN